MECAIWYQDHGSTMFRVFADEAEAARFAAEYNDEALDGCVDGVQFEDGTMIDLVRGHWSAMEAEEQRIRERRAARGVWALDPDLRQRIESPFGGFAEVFQSEDVPAWLGERKPW